MKRILSGIRPTGGIHIGNYLGSLKQWVELSNEPDTDCYFMIADQHALLSFRETPLDKASLDLLAWELAAGLHPEKVTLFLQSAVSAHTELNWIFNSLVTTSELNRMTQYKDLLAQGTEQPSAALFTYPVLQAADILLYKASLIPVGEDQMQHVELARTVASRFNRVTNSELFTTPLARITTAARIMSLHDPSKKMSKSLPQGAILLEDDEVTIRQKIARAVTDSGPTEATFPESAMADLPIDAADRSRLFESMTPGVRNLFVLLEETGASPETVTEFLQQFAHKTLRYSDLKQAVADSLVDFIMPLQARYHEIRHDEAMLRNILSNGTAHAKAMADATLKEAKDLFHILDLNQ